MDLSAAAGELYGIEPERFVERRKALATEARKAGDAELARRIGALRRPTVSAWAVNRLARSGPGEPAQLAELLDLGAELRAAWESGTGVAALDQRRADLVTRLVRATGALAAAAGRPLREPALREVADTLLAATTDPDVAAEVRAGRLAAPRAHAGFGPAGFLAPDAPPPAAGGGNAGGATATGTTGDGTTGGRTTRSGTTRSGTTGDRTATARRRAAEKEAARRRAEEAARRRAEEEAERRRRRAEEAATAAREAESALVEWEAELATAQGEHDAAVAESERLRRDLAAAVSREESAATRLRVAGRERERAARRAAEARRRAADRHRAP
ncbi:hypothetical protein Sru01_16980 [Sphaerisporangium rufum]|uniref:Uncharacterized protein n=1 Tax=Sphaerisporangium rufum TaxID=1381558 RepID=A0A919QZ06_9ACTN|nr:hypothetical protein [Sphaerisporangium rufum]GII76716.1 hypothetical protein Sru01_16980 [Sphaerisporangium rufum]